MLTEDSGEGQNKKKARKIKGSSVIDRMVRSYRERKRMKKLEKLMDRSDLWKGLE